MLVESTVILLLVLSNSTVVAPVPRNSTRLALLICELLTPSVSVHPVYNAGIAAQLVLLPSVVKYLPELAACSGAKALNDALVVVCPVPPYAIPIVPAFHTPVESIPTDVRLEETTFGPKVV